MRFIIRRSRVVYARFLVFIVARISGTRKSACVIYYSSRLVAFYERLERALPGGTDRGPRVVRMQFSRTLDWKYRCVAVVVWRSRTGFCVTKQKADVSFDNSVYE